MSTNTLQAGITQSDKQQKMADLARLAAELGFEIKPIAPARPRIVIPADLSPQDRWRLYGQRGLAVDFLYSRLFGGDLNLHRNEAIYHPVDPADLARCRAMLDMTGARERFMGMANSLSRTWGLLARNWDELGGMLYAESDKSQPGFHDDNESNNWIGLRTAMEAIAAIGYDEGCTALFNLAATPLDLAHANQRSLAIDVAKIKALIRYGANVNQFSKTEVAPLMMAVGQYQYAVAAMEIKNPPTAIIQTLIDGGASLDMAARKGRVGTIRDAIKRGPNAEILCSLLNIETKTRKIKTP